jgi:hypothetical protein
MLDDIYLFRKKSPFLDKTAFERQCVRNMMNYCMKTWKLGTVVQIAFVKSWPAGFG